MTAWYCLNNTQAKRNIEIDASIKDNIFIKADPLSINRIVNNLVENAIKFSFDGGIIEISLLCRDDKIYLTVKDNGIGIPPEMHKKVFEPYYQITNQKRSIQGMGLGLPIVKKVVEDLNGEIQTVSNPKKIQGTKIIIILNEHSLSEKEIITPNVLKNNISINVDSIKIKDSIHDADKQTILIVEDNTTMINYLIMKLQGNYNVYAALNGNEALKKMKSLRVLPDLIISDIMMDKVDGYTLAKIISKDPGYNHIPFIFLSAKSTKDDRLQGLRLGAIDFIQKPFSINELIHKVDSILVNARKQKKAALNSAFNVLNTSDKLQSKNTLDTFEQNCNLYHLTSREKDIAKLICLGHKYKAIGDALFIAERTVTKHVQNIFEKVEVSNKIELINKLETQKSTHHGSTIGRCLTTSPIRSFHGDQKNHNKRRMKC